MREDYIRYVLIRRWASSRSTRWLLALAAAAVFCGTALRSGWNRAETDFPNYYTAAVLVRKGVPLRNYYDYSWFQRQMEYAGIEGQLGAYVPHSPLTMLPLLPLAQYRVQVAKRIWLILDLGFLAGAIFLLSRVTRFSVPDITLLAFAGYGTLYRNFLLGQYYVFLLFILVLAFYLLYRGYRCSSGLVFAFALALKLYGGPFLLYFAAKRDRRAMIGMLIGSLLLGCAAIAIFGLPDIVYFAAHVFPRALQGELADPYNPGNGTFSTLLRRTFLTEPELNPHPFSQAPGLFFFLQTFLMLAVLIFPLMALRRSNHPKRDFAFFFLAVVLASPNTASYTFVLLLSPIVLLLEESGAVDRTILIAGYLLLAIPLRPAWSFLFPKAWLLMFMFLTIGRHYVRLIKPQASAAAAIFLTLISAITAHYRLAAYRQDPTQKWESIAVQPGAIYSSSPAVLESGIIYESIGHQHYILRWLHSGRIDDFSFEGDAFHPVAMPDHRSVRFELITHGISTSMLFDPMTKKLLRQRESLSNEVTSSALSPNCKWFVFTQTVRGETQIFMRSSKEGSAIPVTGGNCSSFSPVWKLDSKSIIFASDCERGIGLPALYRAWAPERPPL